MQGFFAVVENISGFIWGGTWNGEQALPVGLLAVLLLGTGHCFMIRLGFLPIRRLVPALGEAWAGPKARGEDGAMIAHILDPRLQALPVACKRQENAGFAAIVTDLEFSTYLEVV